MQCLAEYLEHQRKINGFDAMEAKAERLDAVVAECKNTIRIEQPSYAYGWTAATGVAEKILKIAQGESEVSDE